MVVLLEVDFSREVVEEIVDVVVVVAEVGVAAGVEAVMTVAAEEEEEAAVVGEGEEDEVDIAVWMIMLGRGMVVGACSIERGEKSR